MKMQTCVRGAAWLLIAAIAVVTLCPIAMRPVTGLSAHLERFVAFAALGAGLSLAYPRHRAALALLVIAAAGLLELAQHLNPSRHGELQDGLVKAAGGACGILAAMITTRLSAQAGSIPRWASSASVRPEAPEQQGWREGFL